MEIIEKLFKTMLMVMFLAFGSVGLTGCEDDGAFEETGEEIDEAGDEMGDEFE